MKAQSASTRPRTRSGIQRSATSSGPLDTDAVRARVLSEHEALRALMEAVRQAVTTEPREDMFQRVGPAFHAFHQAFTKHLRFEERTLVPILRVADAWGDMRVEKLFEEHAAQRAIIVAMAADIEARQSPERVSADLGWLMGNLLTDMVEEEATVLSEDALGEALVVVDQCGG